MENKYFKINESDIFRLTITNECHRINIQHNHWKDFNFNVYSVNIDSGNSTQSMSVFYKSVIKAIYKKINIQPILTFDLELKDNEKEYQINSIEEIFPQPCKKCGNKKVTNERISFINGETCYSHTSIY